MKTILIKYKEKMVPVYIVGDHKATISQEDFGCAGTFANTELRIELDQCKECGVWKSEDEELYGDGYCTECAVMCSECQIYHSKYDCEDIDGEKMCLFCIEQGEIR